MRPAVEREQVVRVGLETRVQADARQHAQHLAARFDRGDAFLEVFLAQLGALQQRQLFQLADLGGRRRQRGLGGLGDHEIDARLDVHQRGEFALREFEVLAAQVEQRGGVEQRALVVQRECRGDHLLRFGLARAGQREVGALQNVSGLRRHALRTERAPVGRAHVLHHVLHHLAAALFGDQELVGLLVRAVVRNTEVEQVPRKLRARGAALAVFRRARPQRLDAVVDADRAAARHVAAVAIAGACQQVGQHVVVGILGQALRERRLHLLQAVVEVVFERARDRLFERDRRGDRRLAHVHGAGIGLHAVAHFVLRRALRRDDAARHEQSNRGERGDGDARRREARGGVERVGLVHAISWNLRFSAWRSSRWGCGSPGRRVAVPARGPTARRCPRRRVPTRAGCGL